MMKAMISKNLSSVIETTTFTALYAIALFSGAKLILALL
jgi:hypothetical protein